VVGNSEEPSSQSQGRTSGSMSSLGQPVSSRYPFQFRHPVRGHSRGYSTSTGASHLTPHSHTTPSTHSRSTNSQSANSQSTGNRSSESPESQGGSSAAPGRPLSASSFGSHIPMPPRHPQPTRGRARAGTLPYDLSSSPTPVVFPRTAGRHRPQTPMDPDAIQAFGEPQPHPADDEEYTDEEEPIERPIPEGSLEAAEEEDHIGLLSAGPSPRTSLVGLGHRPSNLSRRSQGSRSSGSTSSRSRTGSAVSGSRSGSSARSRTQSLIQSIGAASRSSLELVQTTARLRANSSMARLEEDFSYHSDSPSQPGSAGSNENHTFGHPLFAPRESAEGPVGDVPHQSTSNVSVIAPSEHPSQSTVSPNQLELIEPTRQPVSDGASLAPSLSGRPDLGTSAPSFVTDPATQEGTSEVSEQT
jgi:hypothetical protein